jgi:hypothetical protein
MVLEKKRFREKAPFWRSSNFWPAEGRSILLWGRGRERAQHIKFLNWTHAQQNKHDLALAISGQIVGILTMALLQFCLTLFSFKNAGGASQKDDNLIKRTHRTRLARRFVRKWRVYNTPPTCPLKALWYHSGIDLYQTVGLVNIRPDVGQCGSTMGLAGTTKVPVDDTTRVIDTIVGAP